MRESQYDSRAQAEFRSRAVPVPEGHFLQPDFTKSAGRRRQFLKGMMLLRVGEQEFHALDVCHRYVGRRKHRDGRNEAGQRTDDEENRRRDLPENFGIGLAESRQEKHQRRQEDIERALREYVVLVEPCAGTDLQGLQGLRGLSQGALQVQRAFLIELHFLEAGEHLREQFEEAVLFAQGLLHIGLNLLRQPEVQRRSQQRESHGDEECRPRKHGQVDDAAHNHQAGLNGYDNGGGGL